jgi:hypothetical protein
MNSEDIDRRISSAALAGGPSLSDSPDGIQLDLFGQALAPASPSRQQAREKEKQTNDICGQHSFPSSASVNLTASLGSRLVQTLGTAGSMEYALTWKKRVTPSGLRVYRLLARAHRISASDCSGLLFGYPTPEAGCFGMADAERLLARRAATKERTGNGNGFGLTLGQMVPLVFGYPTCEASDATGGRVSKEIGGMRPSGAKRAVTLGTVVSLFGWATTAARDAKGANKLPHSARRGVGKTEDQLPNQAVHLVPCEPGTDSESSSAGTASPGASLNPWFSAWLMGYPPEWMGCLPGLATPSLENSQDEEEP